MDQPVSLVGRPAQNHPPLLELVGLPNKLVLDNVYLNGLHALRRFEIRNISPFPLLVKLRSTLGTQIAFQLTNENLPDFGTPSRKVSETDTSLLSLSSSVDSNLSSLGAEHGRLSSLSNSPLPDHRTPATKLSDETSAITTNTVAAAAIGVFGSEHNALHGHQFNQLFNYVNHIDELRIAPGESQKVILAFLPENPVRGRRPGEKDDSGVDRAAKMGAPGADDETYDFLEVNGLLFFFAYKVDDEDGGLTTDVEEQIAKGDSGPNSDRDRSRPSSAGSGTEGEKSRTAFMANADGVEISSPSAQSPPDFQVTTKFRSRVCRSVLWTDIGDTGITFDDCIVGETYFKDFTVWNRSEIDLFWVLNTVDLSNRQDNTWLRISDCETGEPLDGKPIPAYSPRRVRITFRPREVGEFNYDLQLENANDSSNTVSASIHAVVRSGLREESLVVNSGNVLDFGDCSAGSWFKQRLVLRNVSESPLDIAFSADIPNLVFQLKSDELAQESVPIHAPTVAEAGDRLIDKLRELSLAETATTNSDVSYPPSAVSSRPSSPSILSRKDSEALQMNVSSTDLAALFAATARIAPDNNDDADSDDSDYLDRTVGEGVGSNGEEYRRIEEIILRAGTERVVEVCYRPEKDPVTPDYRGGRLTRRNFRVVLAYAAHGSPVKEKKTIQCKARTCTSYIEVTPTVVNFGDTDVGTLKSASIHITNCSDLTARVELRFVSKVLNTYRDEIMIPPKQAIEAKVDIYPRKVNPEYRKQITVVNLLNRDNDQPVEVRSTNIDKNRVTFHSLFYRILTPTSTNFIDFGAVVLNSSVVRTMTIANISKKRLLLAIESSLLDEVKIYAKGRPASPAIEGVSASTLERRERLLESISDRRKFQRTEGPNGATLAVPTAVKAPGPLAKHRSLTEVSEMSGSADYLDLASSISAKDGRRSPRRRTHVQHYPLSTLKQLRSQYREMKPLFVDDGVGNASSSGRPSTSEIANAQLGEDSFNDPAAKPDEDDSDTEPISKSLELPQNSNDAGARSSLLLKEMTETSKLSVDALINMLESATGRMPPMFGKHAAEEKYVRAILHLQREMDNAIKQGLLVPVSVVDIPPESDMPILIIFTPKGDNKPHIQGKARKQDARINLKLMDFDRDIKQPQFEQLLQADLDIIPVRELMLRSSLCRSIMELNQKNINFGSLNKNEHRTRTIVIRNNSEAPLLYALRKSGSIASGDLIIGDGRMGVVRAFGKREVEFMFDPSLAGPFHEHITIENVQDRENDQVISVKANIRKPAPFFIESLSVDFGPCLINEVCPAVQRIVISNTSFKKTRTFEVRIDPHELGFRGCTGAFTFDLVDNDDDFVDDIGEPGVDGERKRRRRPLMMLSKEMEEEIEHLEQKLKIAKRKGRKDKVKKLIEKLDNLRAGVVDDEYVEKEPKKKEVLVEELPEEGDATPKPIDASGYADRHAVEVPPSDTGDSNGASLEPSRRTSQVASVKESTSAADQQMPQQSQARVKRTDHSIIFALEPRTIRTISMCFRPVELKGNAIDIPSGSSSIMASSADDSSVSGSVESVSSHAASASSILAQAGETSPGLDRGNRETCTGTIYVHEHKNTDILKEVTFRAVVCYDNASFLQALAEEHDGKLASTWAKSYASESTAVSGYVTDRTVESRSPSPLPLPMSIRSGASSPPFPPDDRRQSTAASGPRSNSIPTRDSSQEAPKVDVPAVEPAPTLIIEVPHIELGNIKINERKDCYFTATNRSQAALPFTIMPPEVPSILHFHDLSGVLSIRETRRVDFWMVPTSLGRQSRSIYIRNNVTNQIAVVVFSFYVIASTYLRFPSLPDPLAASAELDFGFCYLDAKKKFSRVLPYDIENVSDEDLYISAVSNLAQQCFIFSDAQSEAPVTDICLPKEGRMTVYIALQPYLSGTSSRRVAVPSKAQAGTSATNPTSSGTTSLTVGEDFRTLVGGIKFLVQKREKSAVDIPSSGGTESIASETLYLLTTYTAKFTALIGQSLLGVSDTLIDLGTTKQTGQEYTGFFHVSNLSNRLPLEFRINSHGDNLQVADYLGRLEGRAETIVEKDTVTSTVSEQMESASVNREKIEFRLRCTEFGLISRYIEVININNSAQTIRVEVRLFADIGSLELRMEQKNDDLSPVEASHATVPKLPLLQWDDVYVDTLAHDGQRNTSPTSPSIIEHRMPLNVILQKRDRAEVAPSYEKILTVMNATDAIIRVIPKSDLEVVVRWSVSQGAATENADGSSCDNGSGSNWSVRGGIVDLQPCQKVLAYVTVPSPAVLGYDDDACDKLVSGKRANLRGLLCFQDVGTATVMKAVELASSYCVSRGEVEPAVVDVGKVGNFNSWGDVKFKITIRNVTEIPLLYDLQLPDAVDLLSYVAQTGPMGIARRKVEVRATHAIEAALKPRLLDLNVAGPQALSISITNLYNPRNNIGITVNAHLTLFELRFERLISGELVLPPLTHPHLPKALPCDSWFTIASTSDEEVKFEIGFALAPDVAEFVRVEVLSRFSNSPLVGVVTLAPRGSIEVRVRAYAREDSRLPANHPNARSLTNPDGITFGTLCIASKNNSTAPDAEDPGVEVSHMTERIPVRGVIMEGQTFALSEKRMEFRTIIASDSDEDESAENAVAEERRTSAASITGEGLTGSVSASPLVFATQRELVYITNLSPTFELDFKVVFEFPMELANGPSVLRASPLDETMCGRVEPGGRLPLIIELLDPRIGGVSDDIKVLIYDKNSLTRQPQVIYLSIVEDATRSLQSEEVENNPGAADQLFLNEALLEILPESLTGAMTVEEPGSSFEDDEDVLFSDDISSSSLREVDRAVQYAASTRPSTNDSVSVPHVRRPAGNLILRGCKRIYETKNAASEADGLFELDLGQQDLASNVPPKKLSIENPCSDRIAYRLRTLSETDKTWIALSRTDGILEGTRSASGGASGPRDVHSITVNPLSNARGVYSTYIFVDNLDNPADTKTIRVSMEIVACQNIRRTATANSGYTANLSGSTSIEPSTNHVFDVYVHGVNPNVTSIVMDPAYFETEYAARSMTIHNRESVPLEFTVNSSLSYEDNTELVFSLSRTYAKLFKTLTVEPESQARVFLRLRPSAESVYSLPQRSTTAEANKIVPASNECTSLAVADEAVEKHIEIYVNCRLVKDYQKIINLRAICRQPQMLLSDHEVFFRGTLKRKEQGGEDSLLREAGVDEDSRWSLQIMPSVSTIQVTNLLLDPLDCWVMNDSMYFNVEQVGETMDAAGEIDGASAAAFQVTSATHSKHRHSTTLEIGPRKSAAVRISPRPDVMLRHADRLRKDKYLVEHLTFYNRKRPKEMQFIIVKMSFGHMVDFQSASGSRHSFAVLEQHIVKLLRDIDSLPDILNSPELLPNTPTLETITDRRSDAHFRFCYIVDQLIYYGTREQAAENYVQLAQLLFSTIFSKSIFKGHAPASLPSSPTETARLWPPALTKWLSTFAYFMDFFPYRSSALEPLRDLARNLILSETVASLDTAS